MKILLNQHISWKLCGKLSDLFDHVIHVKDLGLSDADDVVIIEWCKKNGYSIVTKDSDYNDLISAYGPPPVVIWIRVGNCSTDSIHELLRKNISMIRIAANNSSTGIISII